jgi:hypothetical protein
MTITRCNNCMAIYEEVVDNCVTCLVNDYLMDIHLVDIEEGAK